MKSATYTRVYMVIVNAVLLSLDLYQLGYLRMVFNLSYHPSSFGGHSDHLAYQLDKSGIKSTAFKTKFVCNLLKQTVSKLGLQILEPLYYLNSSLFITQR